MEPISMLFFVRPVAFLMSVRVLALLVPLASAQEAPLRPPQVVQGDTTAVAVTDSAKGARADSGRVEEVRPSDVPFRAEQALTRLRQLAAQAAPDPIVTEIEVELSELMAGIARLRADYAERSSREQLSLRYLEDLRRSGLRYEAQIDRWKRSLSRRARALEDEQEALEQEASYWRRARQAVAQQALPQALREQVAAVVRELERVRAQLRLRINYVLAQQTRLAEAESLLAEYLGQVRYSLAQDALLLASSRPLWEVLLTERPRESFLALMRASWQEEWDGLRYVYRAYRLRMALHVLLLFVLIGLGMAVRRRSLRWPREDEGLQQAAFIASRPVSTALLITCLVSGWFYPQAPLVVFGLATLGTVVPLLRLLPGLIPPSMRAPLYLIVGLYMLHALTGFALTQSLVQRIMLQVENTLALIGLAWILRPGSRATTTDHGPWWKAALFLLRFMLALVAVALVANLVGFAALAGYLTEGTLTSAYVAVVFLIATRVLRAGWNLLVHTSFAQSLRIIRDHGTVIKHRGTAVIRILTLGIWVLITISLFDLMGLQTLWDRLRGVLGASLSVGSLELSLGMILAFLLTMWLSLQVSRLVRFVLNEDVLPHITLPTGVPVAITRLTHYVIMGIGFLLAVAAAGLKLSNLAFVAGALGIGIGFGLQNVVSNFVSGLILIFERPIRVDDFIEYGTLKGQVRRIGIRSSTVRTFDGAEVIVPNAKLIESEVINWTLSDRMRRMEIQVGVAYGTDPNHVIAVLTEAAVAHPALLGFPEPFVVFDGFGDSALLFSLRAWVADFTEFLAVRSDVTVALNEALAKAAIEIPFPQRDLHLRSIDPALREAMRPAGHDERGQGNGQPGQQTPHEDSEPRSSE